jgi:ketosteroid isomerase-like protein
VTADAMTEVQRHNVELVRAAVDIGNLRGVYERFDEFFHPDYEWRPRMVGFGRETYIGRDGFRQYVEDMEATVDEVDLAVADIRPVGDDQVLVLGRLHMVGKGSGVPMDIEWALLYRAEGGLAKSGVAFDSHAEAEEVADAQA